MPLVRDIVKRDDVIQRHASTETKLLQEAIDRINKILEASVDLPVTVTQKELSDNNKVRYEMVRRLKERGWRVEGVKESQDQTLTYTIQ